MNEAISQDIIRKTIVFFLKKTTNFCTATIVDIILSAKNKQKKNAEEPDSSYGDYQQF